MTRTFLAIGLSTLALLPNLSFAKNNLQHQIEYGVINFDSGFTIPELEDYPALINYTYYFDAIKAKSKPYELASHNERISWIKTNIAYDLGGIPNVSGRYYLKNGYDVKYQIFYQTDSISGSPQEQTSTAFMVNFPQQGKWQYGVGMRNTFTEEAKYRRSDSGFFEYDESDVDIDTFIRFQAVYSDIKNNKGWHVTSQFGHDLETKLNVARFVGDYYSAANKSTSLLLSYYEETYRFENRSWLSLGVSQKHWFSPTKAIDYGISYSVENDEGGGSNADIILFDLNGTWRF